MNSRDFCYFLQGLFELAEPTTLNEKQVDLIKRHLNMVFIHEIDPSFPNEQQKALYDAHEGKVTVNKTSTEGNEIKISPEFKPKKSVWTKEPLLRC